MRNRILVLVILALVVGMIALMVDGCSDNNGDDNGNGNPPDTTEHPDTTKPDSTGFGTFELINTIDVDDVPTYTAAYENVLVSASNYRIRIFTLDSPEFPDEVGIYPEEYPYSSAIKSIAVYDTLLYIALENRKIVVLNIADPASPESIGVVTLLSPPQHIEYGDGMLFVGYLGINGSIVDISDPTAPALSGTIPVQFDASDYFNDMLYCVNSNDMVYEISIESAESAAIGQSCYTGGANLDVAVTGWGNLYVGRGVQTGFNTGAFYAYDVNQLGIIKYTEEMPGWTVDKVVTENNFVYILGNPSPFGTSDERLLKIYLAYHLDSIQVEHTATVDCCNCLQIHNNYLYAGARDAGGSGGFIYIYHHEY